MYFWSSISSWTQMISLRVISSLVNHRTLKVCTICQKRSYTDVMGLCMTIKLFLSDLTSGFRIMFACKKLSSPIRLLPLAVTAVTASYLC